MQTIIFAHPDNKVSHNSMVLKEVTENFKKAGKEYQIIDLYADKFNPVLSNEEYNQSAKPDPLILKYQSMLKNSEGVVIIFPVWWYSAPAILKGFFDRVITPGFAFNFKPAPKGLMMDIMNSFGKYFVGNKLGYKMAMKFSPVERHLKGMNVLVVNTFGGPEVAYRLYGKNPSEIIDVAILEFCGMTVKRINWFNAQSDKQIPQNIKDKIAKALN